MKQRNYNVVLIIGYVAVVAIIYFSDSSQKVTPDYSKSISRIEAQQAQDKQDLLDSINATQQVIIHQKKNIERLETLVISQNLKIEDLKKKYESNRNSINLLDADGIVSESRKQLSR